LLRSDALGPDVVVKAECLQRTGSFKFRGAWNRISQLPDRARVVAASSGNHARRWRWPRGCAGCPPRSSCPHDAPALKRAATEAHGATVVGYDRYAEDRMAIARGIAEEQDAVLVPPFDDAHVIAGQGTVGLELLEDAPDVEVLLAPTSGGGLLAGCAVAAGHGVRPVAVEPEAGDDLRRSLTPASGSGSACRARSPTP
jgi:threonine dehydratase